jgi:uncharacterized repeat protein (TIGR02543 family)
MLVGTMAAFIFGCQAPNSSVVHATYTVTYSSNGATGGSVPTDTSAYARDSSVIILGNTGALEKVGFTFSGWNTMRDGSGLRYMAGNTLTIRDANFTLYAEWTVRKYAIIFDANGGSGSMSALDAVTGSSVTLTANAFSNAGYAFSGWNTQGGGLGTVYADRATITVGSSDITLFAQWTNSTSVIITSPNAPATYYVDISSSGFPAIGVPARYTVTYTGNPTAYQWYLDGYPVEGANSSSWTFIAAPADFGRHMITLLVADANGLTYSGSRTIDIYY